jgi:hypothetical protein
MAYTFDPETLAVTLDCGDTFNMRLKLTDIQFDVAVFAIYNAKAREDILKKAVKIESGGAKIRLSNADTRDLEAGNYNWNLRFVSNPAYGENGEVIVDDDSDDVVTLFGPAKSDVPKFTLVRNGAYV